MSHRHSSLFRFGTRVVDPCPIIIGFLSCETFLEGKPMALCIRERLVFVRGQEGRVSVGWGD